MSIVKKVTLGIIVSTIIGLTGSFIATDYFSIFVGFDQNYSPIVKLISSFLASIIAIMIGKDGLSKADTIMLGIAFPLASIGDIFITTNNYWYENQIVFLTGAVFFIFSVLILIIRHSKCFSFLKEDTLKRVLFGMSFFVILIVIVVIFYNELVKRDLLVITIIYGSLVVVSLWTGIAAFIYKLFPQTNAILIFVGSISYFLMELTGQIYNLRVPGWSEAGFILSWAFYTPALIMLALSGYQLEN
ncbi:MAG: hypothetical protein N2258_03970 [Brevinematales bacterium]|nr:hypothetical protein [Brevinematales bacterium]